MLPTTDILTSYMLSSLLPTDKTLLKKAVARFRPHSKNYEDSWGYVIQATRYGGAKWYDPQTGFLIFFGRKSATDSTLVVPLFFADPTYLKKTISIVQTTSKVSSTILKNVDLREVTRLTSLGFRQYHENERWDNLARFDDQTYPQQIVNLELLLQPKGKKYHQLKRILNKKANVFIRTYSESDKDAVLKILSLKDGNTQIEKNGMYYVSHAMYPSADIDKFIITDCSSGEIIGFTATSDISSKTTALVASFFLPGTKIASVWGIYHTLLTKYYKGFTLANLGGCETAGTYIFLNRLFRPIETLEKTHLIFEQK